MWGTVEPEAMVTPLEWRAVTAATADCSVVTASGGAGGAPGAEHHRNPVRHLLADHHSDAMAALATMEAGPKFGENVLPLWG